MGDPLRALRPRRRFAPLLVGALALLACDARDLFVGDRDRDECNGNWPVCTFRAGCNLNDREYMEGSFPGSRRFIVETRGEARIRVVILFLTQISPGSDTEIHWYEPGCFERYSYFSDGTDLFREAGKTGILEKERDVFLAGDHLIEVFSDAVADFLLKVEVSPLDEEGT